MRACVGTRFWALSLNPKMGTSLPEDVAVLGGYTRKGGCLLVEPSRSPGRILTPYRSPWHATFKRFLRASTPRCCVLMRYQRLQPIPSYLGTGSFGFRVWDFSHILLEVLSAPQDLHMSYEFQKRFRSLLEGLYNEGQKCGNP